MELTLFCTQLLVEHPISYIRLRRRRVMFKPKKILKLPSPSLKLVIQIFSTHSLLFHSITILNWNTEMQICKCMDLLTRTKWTWEAILGKIIMTHMIMITSVNTCITGSAWYHLTISENCEMIPLTNIHRVIETLTQNICDIFNLGINEIN